MTVRLSTAQVGVLAIGVGAPPLDEPSEQSAVAHAALDGLLARGLAVVQPDGWGLVGELAQVAAAVDASTEVIALRALVDGVAEGWTWFVAPEATVIRHDRPDGLVDLAVVGTDPTNFAAIEATVSSLPEPTADAAADLLLIEDARAAWTLEKTVRQGDGQTGDVIWWVADAVGNLWTPLPDRDAELRRVSRFDLTRDIESLLAAPGVLGA